MDKNSLRKRTAFIISFIFHLLVVVWLFLFGLSYVPVMGEQGILVNFGDSETGFGMEPLRENPLSQTSVPEETVPQIAQEQETLTQDYEEAPVTEKMTVKKNPVTSTVAASKTIKPAETAQTIVPERKPDPRALFQGRASTGTATGSQGIAGGTGDQGKPGGDPAAESYTGSGLGNSGQGVSFDLSGRSAQSLPIPEYRSQSEGRVVVEVVVDKEGKVVSALPGVRGSTTTDERLIQAAQRAALNSRFRRSPESPVQKGVITYIFRLQN